MCSAPTGCTACGDRKGSRCRRSGRADAWLPVDRGRFRRRRSITSGRATSCFDTCANGQTLKCLTIIDEFTRECLAIDVAGGIRSARVIEVLTQLVSVHGAPRYLRSDNGPEFVARAILRWLQTAAIETAFIDPGKPWQNRADESFNGKFRDQHLSLQWFRNRVEAKVSIDAWRRHDNDVRPHSSLGYLTPAAFKAKHLLNNAPRSIVRTDDIL